MEQRREKDQLEDGVSLRGRMTEHQARGKRGERQQGLEAADGRVIWKGCSCIRSVWAEEKTGIGLEPHWTMKRDVS